MVSLLPSYCGFVLKADTRQIWRSKHGPPPPRKTLDEAPDLPLATANIFSVLSFHVSWKTRIES